GGREVPAGHADGDRRPGGGAVESEPGSDGPRGGDLDARPPLAGGAGRRPGLPGDRERRRSAGGVGRRGGSPGHLGGRGPALARRLLVLPELRIAPAPRRRGLVLRRVPEPAASGPLGARG